MPRPGPTSFIPQADGTIAHGEPISPELVLVSPDLRARALDTLRGTGDKPIACPVPYHGPAVTPALPTPSSRKQSSPSLPVQLISYAAWQMLTGALTGLGAVAAVALSLLAITLILD